MNNSEDTVYAVIDTETGGFSKSKNGLCEVAILIVNDSKEILKSFSTLIRPYLREEGNELVSYKEAAMKINAIDMEDILKAPNAFTVAKEIESVLRDSGVTTIVAHNIPMDKGWVEYFLERFGTGFKFEKTICTLQLARDKKLPVNNNKLPTLLDYFQIINTEEHRALGDAKATYYLWLELDKTTL